MTSAEGGRLEVPVEPDTRGFGAKLRRAITGQTGEVEKASEEAGRRSGLAFAAGLGGAAAAVAGIRKGLDVSADLEQNQVALEGLLGSGREATQFLGDLKTFATGTPFELPGLVDSAQKLLGVGVAAADVIPTLTAFGDVSAAFGLSQDQLSGVLTAVTQSMAKGRFQAEELMQIQERGIPITQILGDAMGKTAGEILEMASAGELTATEVLPVLRDQLNKDYGGSLAAQAGTLTGVISNFKDTVNLALAGAVDPLAEALTEHLPQAAAIAENGIGLFGVGLKAAVLLAEPVLGVILDVVEAFTSLPQPVQLAVLAFAALKGAGPLSAIKALYGAVTDLHTNFQTASAGAVGLTGNIKAAGAAAKSSAVSIGTSGLTGALKGLGVAALLGVVLTAVIDLAGNAKDAQAAMNGILSGVDTSDMTSVSAAIQDLNKELLANQQYREQSVEGANWFSDLFTSADENIDAAAAGIAELEVAQDNYRENVRGLADELNVAYDVAARLAEQGDIDLVGFEPDSDGMVGIGRVGSLGRDAAEGLREVRSAAADTGAQNAYSDALAVINDELSTAEERSNALVDALRELRGDSISILEADADVEASFDSLTESLDAAGVASVDAAGNIDRSTAAGRGVQAAALGSADAMRTAAQAAYDQAVAQGNNAGAAELAADAAQRVRDNFIAQADAAGLTIEQATALADTYGLLPGEAVTNILTPGIGTAIEQVNRIQNELSLIPEGESVTVDALTSAAEQNLINLGYTVTHMDDGSVQVTADTSSAYASLNNFIASANNRTVSVSVGGYYGAAAGGLFAPSRGLAAYAGLGGASYVPMHDGGEWYNGHRLTPMPAGRAAIVPPNTWKTVVGDRKRDDEFYIPDNRDPKSVALAEEWAKRNGYILAQAMADGGFFGSQSRPAAPSSGGGVYQAALLPGAALAVRGDGLFDLIDARVEIIDKDKARHARAERAGVR